MIYLNIFSELNIIYQNLIMYINSIQQKTFYYILKEYKGSVISTYDVNLF